MLTDPESKQITEGLDSKVSKGTYYKEINTLEYLDIGSTFYSDQSHCGIVVRSSRLFINHSEGVRYAY